MREREKKGSWKEKEKEGVREGGREVKVNDKVKLM